jgi:hypothetical protein
VYVLADRIIAALQFAHATRSNNPGEKRANYGNRS